MAEKSEKTSSAKKIALVRGDFSWDEELIGYWEAEFIPLQDYCKKTLNMEIFEELWDDTDVNWNQYDLVVPKAVWDYPRKADKFIDWLNLLEEKGVKTANSMKLLKWNIDKRYFSDLEKRGIPIAAFVIVERGNLNVKLSDVMEENHWSSIVIKPTLGCHNHKVHFIHSKMEADLFQEQFESDVSKQSFILQRFVSTVAKYGEWSVLYFDNIRSHTVNKSVSMDQSMMPTVQSGTKVIPNPDQELCKFADNIMSSIKIPEKPLYARVDVAKDENDSFILGELELIEPYLFYDQINEAMVRFAEALALHA